MSSVDPEVTHFTGSEGNRLAASIFRPADGCDHGHPPILLMHGGGQTRHSWQGTAEKLMDAGRTAITVDARGHGASDWLKSANYSFLHYAADLETVAGQTADMFGALPVLVGASLGGISAMVACAENGGKGLFSSLIFVDITPTMEREGVERIMGFMTQRMREGFSSPQEAADAISAYLPTRKRPSSLEGLRKNLRLHTDGRYYWHWDPAFVDGPCPISTGYEDRHTVLVDAVKAICVPALLVRGTRSELVSEEAAREFLQMVPHAKYRDVSDAGHMVAGDRNDAFTTAVMEFLEDGDQTTSA